jgi:hypothetical protein
LIIIPSRLNGDTFPQKFRSNKVKEVASIVYLDPSLGAFSKNGRWTNPTRSIFFKGKICSTSINTPRTSVAKKIAERFLIHGLSKSDVSVLLERKSEVDFS